MSSESEVVSTHVAVQAGSDFMFYSGGVYSGTKYGDSFLEIQNVCGLGDLLIHDPSMTSVLSG